MLECKTEKWNSQCEHGQPIKQTGGLFCTYGSGVDRCQLQHQCHFWRISSMFCGYCTMFEVYCTSEWTWQLSFMRLWTVATYKVSLKDTFEKCGYKTINQHKTPSHNGTTSNNSRITAVERAATKATKRPHECDGRIEKSVPRIAVWHHEASRVMTNGDPEGRIFYPTLTLIIDSFNCSPLILFNILHV